MCTTNLSLAGDEEPNTRFFWQQVSFDKVSFGNLLRYGICIAARAAAAARYRGLQQRFPDAAAAKAAV